jgi:hypothetical protein
MADKRRRFVYVTDGHAVDGKVPAGEVPESWRCVDCGVDTAPGIMNRVELERALAAGKASGSGWDCVASIEQTAPVCGSGGGVEQVIDFESEVYCVRAVVWKAARMKPFGGCLCIGCLEKRLRRELKPKDFLRGHGLNAPDLPGTPRLMKLRKMLADPPLRFRR